MANKFNARRTMTPDGILHASAKEAHRWGVLRLLQRNGLIRDLQRQVRIPLRGADGKPLRFVPSGRAAFYVCDFAYHDVPKGVDVIEDDAGNPQLLELELTEPSLFFATAPGAADRFAAVLLGVLAAD